MTQNTIWITGASGKLGNALVKKLKENPENKIIGTDKDVDITDFAAVEQIADINRPNIVINCASISDAAYCEANMAEAFKVNALGARNIAAATRSHNAKIIQLSTDDIFDGKSSGRLTEFDTPKPQSVYGKSKLAGENFVRDLNPRHLIIRSSWVYGTGEQDYFRYVEEKGQKGEAFTASIDKISTPTSANELAKLICILTDHAEYGIFHASCEGACSRFEFARTILGELNMDTKLVSGTFSDKGKNSSTVLENLMLKMTEIYDMPHWTEDLRAYIRNLKED